MTSSVTAIVPIKENSERVPGKNFKDFNGKPLYHWIVGTLDDCEEVDKIMINTDAEQVMENAEDLSDKVEVSERPERLRGDGVSMNKIIEYEVGRNDADLFLQTHCTNPLLETSTISGAIEKFADSDEHDSLFAVTRHQGFFYDEDMNPINHDPDKIQKTQDLPPIYEDNSNIFLFTEETIEENGGRIGNDPLNIEIDEIESMDIDYPEDFRMAEYFHRERN